MKSVDSSWFIVEPDPVTLLQYVLLCPRAFCTSSMPFCYLNFEVLNTVLSRLKLIVCLILCLCIPVIPNCFLEMYNLNAIRNALLLLPIATWYVRNEIPEPYPIVAHILWYLEYLLVHISRTHPVWQNSYIPIPLIWTSCVRLRPLLNNPLLNVMLL